MNSKTKTIVFLIVFTLTSITSSVSNAASLSVCGEQKNTNQNPDVTPYDNYSSYQKEVINLNAQLADHKITQDQYYTKDAALKEQYNICQASDIFKQIARITNFLIGFIGVFVIIRLVMSGFQMVMSQGNEESIKGAKSGITNALIGLVLVFAAYLIVNIIFSVIGVSGFNINPFA
jgi:hypothetical protein